ncbi:hypothetical protein GCM10011505_50540 [Tistrella bauzanensis]|uniref:Uncharacterized protein n=1 Tax=Tistrella bauzanensis TaxID=657419 RepID=A0ABQ1JA58_9PROT|nr:hypothetical protein [Tistrella bauzanensis]GGB63890.1 hypothetical protein GCM10011505_50540 [Tistrella bauzanensis]
MSPRTTITIAANQSIDLGVAEVNVGDAGQLPSVQIQVGYFNVGGVTSAPPLNHKTAHFTIALRKSPDLPPPPTINDQVDYRFVNGHEHDHGGISNVEWITVTAQGDSEHINAFTLEIRPAIGKPSINAGPATYMIITFVIADGPYGALASAADLANIRMTPDEGADGWEIVHRSDVPDPYWRVAIPDGRVISGRLRLDNVVSHLDPGWSEMSIQYHNVPHFRDGQLDIPIYKYGAPVLEQASAERHEVFLDGATVGAYLTLSWSCFSSERVHVQLSNANGYGRDLGIFDGEVGSYHAENQDWIKYLPDGTMATFSAVPLTYPFAGGSRDDGFLPVGSVPVTSTYQTMLHHGSDGGPEPV